MVNFNLEAAIPRFVTGVIFITGQITFWRHEVIRPDMSVRLGVTFVRGVVLCVTPAVYFWPQNARNFWKKRYCNLSSLSSFLSSIIFEKKEQQLNKNKNKNNIHIDYGLVFQV